MVSFEGFNRIDGTPVYLQIIQYVKRGIISGTIEAGDELPSRRSLSMLLNVNPNTIQKAYRELEEEGYITSQLGSVSVMSFTADQANELVQSYLGDGIRQVVRELKEMGIGRNEAQKLLELYWDEREGKIP